MLWLYIVCFVAGIFIGAFVGFFAAGLCQACGADHHIAE